MEKGIGEGEGERGRVWEVGEKRRGGETGARSGEIGGGGGASIEDGEMWGGLGIGGEGRRVVGLGVNVLDKSRGLSWRTDSMYLVEQILGF